MVTEAVVELEYEVRRDSPGVADVVGGDGAIVVEIGFVVGNGDWVGNVVEVGDAATVLFKLSEIAAKCRAKRAGS